MKNCLFCHLEDSAPILENQLAKAFFDKTPVSKGHLLIIPKRHIENYFDLTQLEKKAIDALLLDGKAFIDTLYQPDGYNIGANCGESAGQTIFHCHIHLIPRYQGDLANPRGGVRGVIPDKRIY